MSTILFNLFNISKVLLSSTVSENPKRFLTESTSQIICLNHNSYAEEVTKKNISKSIYIFNIPSPPSTPPLINHTLMCYYKQMFIVNRSIVLFA